MIYPDTKRIIETNRTVLLKSIIYSFKYNYTMKTKLTLDKLKSADFLEIIEKDEMESSIGGTEPPPSCVFHCLDFLDGDAFDWQHYSIETHEVLGY